jgi:hypothetical protein
VIDGAVSITDVVAGPAGLVVVTMRTADGKVRRMVLPPKLAGVAEVEWSAQALAMLTQLQTVGA